jgi:hypothetical protein
MSSEYNNPDPMVARSPPITIRGAVWPVLVMLPPETMIDSDIETIKGRFRTPDMIGLTF